MPELAASRHLPPHPIRAPIPDTETDRPTEGALADDEGIALARAPNQSEFADIILIVVGFGAIVRFCIAVGIACWPGRGYIYI